MRVRDRLRPVSRRGAFFCGHKPEPPLKRASDGVGDDEQHDRAADRHEKTVESGDALAADRGRDPAAGDGADNADDAR
jgi:hypothetical protein